MRSWLASLVLALFGAAGCGRLWRVGALVVTDEHGRVGALAVGAVGGGFGGADEEANTRSYAVTVTGGVRGGVLDGTPSGMGAVDLGLDIVELWRRIGFRIGALGLVGGVGGGPGGHFAGGVGARVALLPIVRARARLIADRPGQCWGRDVQAIGLEVGAAYLFGPERAVFSFGPMYEQLHGEGGNCD